MTQQCSRDFKKYRVNVGLKAFNTSKYITQKRLFSCFYWSLRLSVFSFWRPSWRWEDLCFIKVPHHQMPHKYSSKAIIMIYKLWILKGKAVRSNSPIKTSNIWWFKKINRKILLFQSVFLLSSSSINTWKPVTTHMVSQITKLRSKGKNLAKMNI